MFDFNRTELFVVPDTSTFSTSGIAMKRFMIELSFDETMISISPISRFFRLYEPAIAGSYRRKKRDIGDIDIIVSSKDNSIIKRFIAMPEVEKVLVSGTTKSSVLLKSNIQADLRLIPKSQYGSGFLYFTGSKA